MLIEGKDHLFMRTKYIALFLVLTTNAVDQKEHYDLKLHYRPLQVQVLENLHDGNVQEKLDTIQNQLITKVVSINNYNIVQKRKTLKETYDPIFFFH
jgi:hypothetical protein